MPVPHDMQNMSHWYPSECCSRTDCFPLADGDVIETPNGYKIQSTGELFAYGTTYGDSQDGKFHRCSSSGVKTNPTLIKSNKACLFPPGAGA